MFGTKKTSLSNGLASFLLALAAVSPGVVVAQDDGSAPGQITKNGIDIDVRSLGKQISDGARQAGTPAGTSSPGPVTGSAGVPQIQTRGGNVQVNDPGLDNIQILSNGFPLVKFTQSETSVAAFGNNIVATYNSTANQQISTSGQFLHALISGFSTSNDGGKTWTSGFFPPIPGSLGTFGDPSVDVDRHGNFYFACLGSDALGRGTVNVNRSTDGGRTWGDPTVVQVDNGSDKEWLAVGPDPGHHNQDNVYVTWTSLQPRTPPATGTRGELRVGRSTDGGATWTARTIFVPARDNDPTHPTDVVQFSNPYVDPITGRLYVPFVQLSNGNQDFIRILASDDAGETFTFLTFDIPGAPSPTLLPVVWPGELVDMGSGGVRPGIHAGAPSAGRFGRRLFRNVNRMTVQPAFAARNGVLYLAWSNSTSPIFGDPNGKSNVLFIRSDDGGATWTPPVQVNPTAETDLHHVVPSLALDTDPNDVHVSYYTQHGDETVDVDLANSRDRGDSFPSNRTLRVTSTSFALPPTVNRVFPASRTNFATTNYDDTIIPGYALGEYMSAKAANGSVYVLWGDCRNTVTEPFNPFIPYLSNLTHSQEDVFFQIVKAQ
ncbi:MAG TPA: sialidase family protein [Thermoanaerobaculia bacterium]|nr:sialidase family protein [Thermoanaerobaculia bacterium]